MKKHNSLRAVSGAICLALTVTSLGIMPNTTKAVSGSISINEICSKNSVHAAADGNFYDWIELFNSSDSSVDLSGWGLSDKDTSPYLYTFPQGSSIGPKSYMIVYCESKSDGSNNIAPFGLSTSGETVFLTDPDGNSVDFVEFGIMAENETYGQFPDGSGKFAYMNGTPGAANQSSSESMILKAPVFSAESGFYDSSFKLTITADSDASVYYTTDGSVPTVNSAKYTEPIDIADVSDNPNVLSAHTDISADQVTAPNKPVDKANVIRAVVIDNEGNTSGIVTKTYFVGKTSSGYYKNMKVVSLVTDQDNLYDYDKGIYVLGKCYDDWIAEGNNPYFEPWAATANYSQSGREWEREANFELFESGQTVLNQDVGIRIKGAASRSSAQKSFNIYARKDYGAATISYDFYEGENRSELTGKKIKEYDGITLRNGGNDNSYAFFRDSINQQLVSNRAFATQATEECIVFLDGEYWGIYQITEKVNDDYISSHYGIKKRDVAIIKNSELEEGTDADLRDFEQLYETFANADMSIEKNYNDFCELVDIQSYIDYFCAQIYWCNVDWPNNNYAMWRSNAIDPENPYADGKWRMFMFDTEYSTGLYGQNTTQANSDMFSFIRQNQYDSDINNLFINLLENDSFKEQFCLTFMDIANDNFSTDKTTSLIDYYKTTYMDQLIDNRTRYMMDSSFGFGGFPGFGGWGDNNGDNSDTSSTSRTKINDEYNTITSFYNNRYNNAAQQLRNALGLSGNMNTINVENEPIKGTVMLNTVSIEDNSWSGKYYSDYDITLKAEPKQGYRFSHWEVNGGNLSKDELNSSELSFALNGNVTVKAVYEETIEGLLKGDYNADGKVDADDLILLNDYLLGRGVTIAETDMIEDGITNSLDLAALRKAISQ